MPFGFLINWYFEDRRKNKKTQELQTHVFNKDDENLKPIIAEFLV